MTAEQIAALGPALGAFLAPFQECFVGVPSAAHLQTYCRGLLADLPRKSVEPIALAAGTAVRTLQEFLRDHVWDHADVLGRLRRTVAGLQAMRAADDLGTIGIIDETTVAKKGDKTPGVQRMYCGAAGKVENCILTVHLAVARGRFKTLVDADLYIPKSWDADRRRCRAAKIPDSAVHRTKSAMALEQVARARADGLRLDWLGFDEAYGGVPAFLAGLDAAGQRFVGEVPASFRCFTVRPAGRSQAAGYRRRAPGKRADSLVRRSPAFRRQEWTAVSLPRQTLAPQVWQAKAARVFPSSGRRRAGERAYWLIVARQPDTGEVKYFVSNAPPDTPVATMVRVGFTRWNVEHCFRAAKSELGLSHFEGRSWVGLMRHMALCLLTMAFAADRAAGLREKKSGDDAGAGVPGAQPRRRRLAAPPAGRPGPGARERGHPLPPIPKPRRPRVPPARLPAEVAL
jgi:SRSO17 transposase